MGFSSIFSTRNISETAVGSKYSTSFFMLSTATLTSSQLKRFKAIAPASVLCSRFLPTILTTTGNPIFSATSGTSAKSAMPPSGTLNPISSKCFFPSHSSIKVETIPAVEIPDKGLIRNFSIPFFRIASRRPKYQTEEEMASSASWIPCIGATPFSTNIFRVDWSIFSGSVQQIAEGIRTLLPASIKDFASLK